MKFRIILLLAAAVSALSADEVQLQDGSILKGTISAVSGETIELDTPYAGPLKLDRAQVVAFSTDEPVYVRLNSGMVVPGTVQAGKDADSLVIKGVDAEVSTAMDSVKESWLLPENDPEILSREKAVAEMQRKWDFHIAANVSGKAGNTEEKSTGIDLSAVLTGKEDELKFYGRYQSKEGDGQTTSDERKAGLKYTSYFKDPWGWYVRHELEQDPFENIELRAVTASGLSYRYWNFDDKKLSANTGLSYRYESYDDGDSSTKNLGLDIGLQHFYRLKNRIQISNEITYVPSIEDFTSYLVTQNSHVDFPLGDSTRWKIRAGLRNDYNSQVDALKEKLDTTYYSSLVASWQ